MLSLTACNPQLGEQHTAATGEQPTSGKGVIVVLTSMAYVQTLALAGVPARRSWLSGCAASRPSEESIVRLFRRCVPLVLLLALVFTVGPHVDAAPPGRVTATDLWSYDHVPGDLLVGFRSQQPFGANSGVSGAFDRYLSSLGVQSASPAIGDGRTYRLHFDLADDLQARREQFLSDSNVAFVEPNYLLTMDVGPTGPLVPNDENYKQQWGPPKIGADQT